MNRIRSHIIYPVCTKATAIEGEFDAAELLMLAEYYPHGDTEILAMRMGRTTRSVTARANAMGLRKIRKGSARAGRELPQPIELGV